MKDGNKVRKILETLLNEKFGGSKYLQYSKDPDTFAKITVDFLEKELKSSGVTSGPANSLMLSAIRQIKKCKSTEAILTVLSETLFKIV